MKLQKQVSLLAAWVAVLYMSGQQDEQGKAPRKLYYFFKIKKGQTQLA